MPQNVTVLVAPGMPTVKSSAEMTQWRKKQTEGYGATLEQAKALAVKAIPRLP